MMLTLRDLIATVKNSPLLCSKLRARMAGGASGHFRHIHDRRSREQVADINTLLSLAFAHINLRYADGPTGIPTGFKDLDNLTGGLHPSELTILAARTDMGKTSLALNIAENMTMETKIPTLLVSLDLSRVEVICRILSSQGRIHANKLRGDPDRMNAGYYVRKKEFKEMDLANPLVLQLLTGRAFDDLEGNTRLSLDNLPTRSRIQIVPANGGNDSSQESVELQSQDVGIGISQVVPVIVTALDGSERLLTIEQPELHLHPRLQANLADLFIEAALGDRHHLLILETHSELLPLRLMRRIRETAEGTLPSHLPHIRAKDVAIYYVEIHEGATISTHLELGKQGQLLDPWPDGFFEDGYRERFSE
jgi:hypothetical protein